MTAPAFALRLCTLADGSRDGTLALVDPDLARCARQPAIARTLQAALDDWSDVAPALDAARAALDAGGWRDAEPFAADRCMAPLPRAYQWVDASVYREHARLLYRWRNEPIPATYDREPLVYQGGSDVLLGPTQPIDAADEAHDIDCEAEIAVVTTDVSMGSTADESLKAIALVVLVNDVSLRRLIGPELAKGFGFYRSKPASAFAPVAVTPAALGDAWRDGMLHGAVEVDVAGRRLGAPDAGEHTAFHFGEILAHLAATRSLGAGTIVGAGTISNAGDARGSACITEARMRQSLAGIADADLQAYLRHGDRVRIEMRDTRGRSVFGAIDQPVAARRLAAR